MSNTLIAIAMLAFLLAGLRLQGVAVARGWIAASASRKLAHIVLGGILLFSWLLYREGPGARWLAAIPPLGLTVHFVLLAVGVIQDQDVVRSASRSGHRREFLLGPVFYVFPFALLTVLFWRNSPAGIVALSMMIFGDGFAEVVGQGIASPKLPWSPGKSVAGSSAMIVMGWLAAACLLWIFTARGHLVGPWEGYLVPLGLIAFVGAAIESLPMREVDNLTVPLGCAGLGYLLF